MAPDVSPLEYFSLPFGAFNIQKMIAIGLLPSACWIYPCVELIVIPSSRASMSKNEGDRSDSFLKA